ncbi:hypothetical protein GCM10027569_87220 [Flindersiella endophytica]
MPVRSILPAVIGDDTPIVPDPSFELRAGDVPLILSRAAIEAEIHADVPVSRGSSSRGGSR